MCLRTPSPTAEGKAGRGRGGDIVERKGLDMMGRYRVPAWSVLAMVVPSLTACSAVQVNSTLAPDVVYVGGTVITMDLAGSRAEAVAVRGDRIVVLGTRTEIEGLVGQRTRVVDPQGRVLVPGFYAPHDDFPGAGNLALHLVDLNSPPMGPIETIDDLVKALAARAETVPEGTWIVGRGYDDTLLKEKRHPTRHDLDRASTVHPTWIRHTSGHLGVGNSLALEMAGLDETTPAPEDGVIRKDPSTGEPTGVFEERAMNLIGRLVPAFGPEERQASIEWRRATTCPRVRVSRRR